MSLPEISTADLRAKIEGYIAADGLASLTVGSVRKRLNESFKLTDEQNAGLKALCAELVTAVSDTDMAKAVAKTAAPAPKAQSKPPKEEKKRKPEPTPAPEGSDDSDESGGDFGSGSGSGSEGDSSGSSDDDAEEIEEEGDEGIGKVVEGAAVSKEDEQLAALRKIITKARLGVNIYRGLKELPKSEQVTQLSSRIKEAGISFAGDVPTQEEMDTVVKAGIKRLAEAKEAAEALEGIDTSNIIEGGRRSRRGAAPAPAPVAAPPAKKSKPVKRSGSDSEEAEF